MKAFGSDDLKDRWAVIKAHRGSYFASEGRFDRDMMCMDMVFRETHINDNQKVQ